MIFKSILEEWPYHCDTVWLRWTEDGVNYREEIMSQNDIDKINAIGVPEWRPIDPPEWMSEEDKLTLINYEKGIKRSDAQE